MDAKKSVQNKRDWILATLLFVLLGGLFIAFRLFAFADEASLAHVYYGNSDEPIVTIDFINYRVISNYDQNVPSEYDDIYPVINEGQQTITLLGDYEINGERQIVVIRYDYGRKSVEIIQEQSPNNICSREGESTGWPLICLPNRIRVEFETNDEDFTV
ncbi:MAG TPA: hypothetical protein DEG42_07265 [Acholeplasmataceae bacterium]|nr:MAG: hypothetical protein A2Y43_02115 [Tenericutes bacterium GWA2_38_26]OHE31305.1 MAG: hypothetical protein A2084_01800 [Tenericutes bacterium GWC2_39_45]OHE32474.1 MAG: hypothetical protein A2009_00410 [Tenericutes bacterium GWD2_38_27]OHE40044.1 MAG: hypothetical protein A2013_02285 [Tenericutes bacterium GWE2_38_8]HBG32928.1 hypothetical protein [Acholeplasmataceae bacterium]